MAIPEQAAHTELLRIPLGRRIGEIMEERGEAFSIRAFSSRVGLNRETLRLMILGARPILPNDLHKIINGLGLEVERLKQIDTLADEQELQALLRTQKNLRRVVQLAEKLASNSLGITEKCNALNNLGRALFISRQYNQAHDAWLTAYSIAERIQEKYGDGELVHKITVNLLLTYSERKEYSNIEVLLGKAEKYFADDPMKLGFVYYTRMRMSHHQGDIAQAKEHANTALNLYRQTYDHGQIGNAEISAAYLEYLTGDYSESEKLLKSAISHLEDYGQMLMLAVKEYTKCLIKLDRCDDAIQTATTYLPNASEYTEFEGKLKILISVAGGDVAWATGVAEDIKYLPKVRYYACRYLISYYKERNDDGMLLRYYNKADALLKVRNHILDEEDF